ncbi:hypothetical protein OAB36_00480 [Pelagibacteraceae bacterium]|nr:hypothetical protein [Pelagibacteraceae bacterium]
MKKKRNNKKKKKPKSKSKIIKKFRKKVKNKIRVIKKFRKKNISKIYKKNKKKKQKKIRNRKLKKSKKTKKSVKINKQSKLVILKIIRITDKLKPKLNFNLDQYLQRFFQKISDSINKKVDEIALVLEEERLRKKQDRIKKMFKEKSENEKKIKLEKQLALVEKKKEYRDELRLEKERKKDLQKFIRLEQAHVRKEQADKQRKFLEQIKLEKKIEQFRKREALEIKNLEKFVLSQERESYVGVQDRIDAIKQKYQNLRDKKIRQRIEELGIEVTDSDTRSELLEKERKYNLERQKIEFALESYYRSMASCVFQLNKRWIPKKMSLLRVLDYRYERSEIFIKFDEDEDEKWLMLVYIKNNDPEAGIIVEDKTDPERNISIEYKTNEIFKFSDALVDSLTNLLDRERKKKIK